MLVAVCGQMGSGKTLLMSILGLMLKNDSVPVYANYDLQDSIPVNSQSNLIKIANGAICLDEFWLTLDSRNWKNNVFLTRWINQTRKKNLIVFYTTQSFGQIDIRVRNATDYVIYCENKRKKGYHKYTFINWGIGKVERAFKLLHSKARLFFDVYDTYKVIYPLKNEYINRFRRSY
jgi:type IV secretory pathway VirB4 component